MTVTTNWMQNTSYAGSGDRQLIKGLATAGILADRNSFKVTQYSGGISPRVDIAPGSALIVGADAPTTQGSYIARNDTTITVGSTAYATYAAGGLQAGGSDNIGGMPAGATVDAAHNWGAWNGVGQGFTKPTGSDYRTDLIILKVRDREHTLLTADHTNIEIVRNNVLNTMAYPTGITGTYIPLAQVQILAVDTVGIDGSRIWDVRPWAQSPSNLTIATSSTRPPVSVLPTTNLINKGQMVYETDTDKLQVFTTPTTGWRPPWNMPWGIVASDTRTSTLGPITSAPTEVATLDFAAVSGRRYKFTVHYTYNASLGAGDTIQLIITNGIGSALSRSIQTIPVNGWGTFDITFYETGFPTGLATRKLYTSRIFGTSSSWTIHGAVPDYGQFTIEDIGPAAAPA